MSNQNEEKDQKNCEVNFLMH